MRKNVGGSERFLRFILGIAICGLFFVLEGNLRWVALIGLWPLGTSAISWCLLNKMIGRNSCKIQHNK